MDDQFIALTEEGVGEPLVVVHGWGFGRRAFDPVARQLAARWRLIRVDLPGCGASRPDFCGANLDAIAASVLAEVPRPAAWLGWSLGGLVALAAARQQPDAVTALTLVAATPRFVADGDWPGIDPETLATFAQGLQGDPAIAHGRFLGFQLAGSERTRPALRALRAASAADGLPQVETLAAGLDLLANADLRGVAGALSCPVGAILGERDPVVPAAVRARLERESVNVGVIAGAGHAPFASHPSDFLAALQESDP
jgi:pimeloyl-[acyl-carrier protein] methyl ester esterase